MPGHQREFQETIQAMALSLELISPEQTTWDKGMDAD